MRNRIIGIAEEKEVMIDVTPMLDVIFIMLIFFIVTATFVKEKGINLPTPSSRPSQVTSADNILIQIMSNDLTYIKGKDVDIRRIAANIQRLKAENPSSEVIIQASKRSRNNTLVQVIDGLLLAGVPDFSMTQSSE